MTCIAGIVLPDGTVYIGGDAMSSSPSYHYGYSVTNPKVFFLDKPFGGSTPLLIGITSSWRMAQIIEHGLSVPADRSNGDPLKYLIGSFIESVREAFKKGGFAEVQNNVEEGGTFLVGYGGRLFKVQDNYSVMESLDPIDSCGSGYKEVLAAMRVLPDVEPEERITRALEATAAYNITVQPPFMVKKLDAPDALRAVA